MIRQRKESAPGWLITYSDMMSLLLVLFTFLFSLQTLRPARHVTAASGRDGLGLPVVLEVRFDPGTAVLSERSLAKIRRTRERIAWNESTVVLLGHAAPFVPPEGSAFSSAALDELAKERAFRVLEELRRSEPPGEERRLLYGTCGAFGLPSTSAAESPPGALGRTPLGPAAEPEDKVEICLLTSKLARELH